MKNKHNISKTRVKTVIEQQSIYPYLSKLSMSEMSIVKGGIQMDDGTLYDGMNSYLIGKVDLLTGKPSEMRFGNIENYPYKPK